MIVHDGMVLSKRVDSEVVGKLIYTKSVGSDSPENLTGSYKQKRGKKMSCVPSLSSLIVIMREERETVKVCFVYSG